MTRLTIKSTKPSTLSALALLCATLIAPASANPSSGGLHSPSTYSSPIIVLTVVTRIMSDGRVITQETAQHSIEECQRLAEMVNTANGEGSYEFLASCREGASVRGTIVTRPALPAH